MLQAADHDDSSQQRALSADCIPLLQGPSHLLQLALSLSVLAMPQAVQYPDDSKHCCIRLAAGPVPALQKLQECLSCRISWAVLFHAELQAHDAM